MGACGLMPPLVTVRGVKGRRSWTDHFNPILFSLSMYSFFSLDFTNEERWRLIHRPSALDGVSFVL